jgi:small GTP-binding protein
MSEITITMLGDAHVGKTSCLLSYTTNGFSFAYNATVMDTYKYQIRMNESEFIDCQVFDAPGSSEFSMILDLLFKRPTSVYMIFFAVSDEKSFLGAQNWYSELKKRGITSPVLFVGSKVDLRDNNEENQLPSHNTKALLSKKTMRTQFIAYEEASNYAQSKDCRYIECSALTQQNLKETFEEAYFCALKQQKQLANMRK